MLKNLCCSEGIRLCHAVTCYMCCLQEYDRPNSAYMLFYERSEAMEPVDQIASLTSAAPWNTYVITQQPGCLQSPSSLQTDLQQLHPSEQDLMPPKDATGQVREESIVQPQIFDLNPEGSLQQRGDHAPAVMSPGPSTPVLSQRSSSPSRTPNCLAPLADVSPLKVLHCIYEARLDTCRLHAFYHLSFYKFTAFSTALLDPTIFSMSTVHAVGSEQPGIGSGDCQRSS